MNLGIKKVGDLRDIISAKNTNDEYVVMQVILRERIIGTGANQRTVDLLNNTINGQCAKGYRLHSFSQSTGHSKGVFGSDMVQVTLVFEKLHKK